MYMSQCTSKRLSRDSADVLAIYRFGDQCEGHTHGRLERQLAYIWCIIRYKDDWPWAWRSVGVDGGGAIAPGVSSHWEQFELSAPTITTHGTLAARTVKACVQLLKSPW